MPMPRMAVAALALALGPIWVLAADPAPGKGAPVESPGGPLPSASGGPAGAIATSALVTEKAGAPEVKDLLAKADAAYGRRHEPGRLDEVRGKLESAEKLTPNDYDVLWRLSRYYFWVSDDPNLSDDERSQLGKKGWEYGDRAAAENPRGVEGWFFGVGGMGNYSLGIGILKALSQGLESKFKERLGKAQEIDPRFLNGGVENAWGRFYYKLPWPKYDPGESERHLIEALRINPKNVRGQVYLAELYLREHHPKEARALLEKATSQPVGQYDEPEERRYQERARAILSQLR